MSAPGEPLAPAAAWSAHCGRGELAYQVTTSGRPVFPPRLAEPGTGGPLEWRVSLGRGTVHATTVVRPRGEAPRNVAIVELDEGFRMMSRVDDISPTDVRIGMRVRVRFDGDLPVFVPFQ